MFELFMVQLNSLQCDYTFDWTPMGVLEYLSSWSLCPWVWKGIPLWFSCRLNISGACSPVGERLDNDDDGWRVVVSVLRRPSIAPSIVSLLELELSLLVS